MGSKTPTSLAAIMADTINEANGNKRAFKAKARAALQALARELGLEADTFEISTTKGAP